MAVDPTELGKARESILLATLGHAPFDGWSPEALERGIADSGVEGPLARLAFQGGVGELAEYYSRYADERMLAALDDNALAHMRIRERIGYVVRLRLEQAAGEREAVRSVMNWLALPGNQGAGARCLYRTVDAMWYGIGDTATDFNFYTKRATLAAVVGATVLYWLNDDSEGYAATWSFLERRLDDVMAFERAKARARDAFSRLPDPFRILKDVFQGPWPPR